MVKIIKKIMNIEKAHKAIAINDRIEEISSFLDNFTGIYSCYSFMNSIAFIGSSRTQNQIITSFKIYNNEKDNKLVEDISILIKNRLFELETELKEL